VEKVHHVYVTRMIPGEPLSLLKKHCHVEINSFDRPLSKQELLEKVKGNDAIMCQVTDLIDDAILAAAGAQCRIVANYSVAHDNIDIAAATKRKIWVTNIPGILDKAVAEITWALIFAVSRRIVEADGYTRHGQFKGWGPMMFHGQEVAGRTLGIIGAGRIGSRVARGATGFGMKILYYDEERKPELESETGAVYVDKETLLREADFISLHVPQLPSTHHLIGEEEFSLMKNCAILINTARGTLVDERALVRALNKGAIWGAGLDVYENEPTIAAELLKMNNVVILPHVGSATAETRTQMGMIAANCILQALNRIRPEHCLNPQVVIRS